MGRKLANAFILGVLAYQIGMPLSYYLSDRVYDERFSWRMFSTVRLQECQVSITETVMRDGNPVDEAAPVAKDLQVAWVNILKRLRPSVIGKYLQRRCDKSGARDVRVSARCTDTDGAALPERRFAMACAARELREESAP